MKTLLLVCFYLICYNFSNAQIIETIAGNGSGGDSGDGGSATTATMMPPVGGVFDNDGNFYFVERLGNRIREISNYGVITTFAGIGTSGFSGDGGPATNAQLNNPGSIAIDNHGNIYIAEINNCRIRKIAKGTNVISTIAGNGTATSTGDGSPATTASLLNPNGISVDTFGNVYILETSKIREINTIGIINTIVGSAVSGFGGDGGIATAAQINAEGIYVDNNRDIYIADFSNNRVRKVDAASGIINSIAGNGIAGYNGDGGMADTSEINPIALTKDFMGNLFIADVHNNSIRKIDVVGLIYTDVGIGAAGFGGDGGSATAALLHSPEGVAFDVCGNLYISDEANHRIRKVTYPPILTIPTIALSGIPSATIGALVTVTATVTNAGSSYEIEWYNHGIEFTTTTVPSVTYTKPAGVDTITARVVSTATYGCYDSTTSAGHVVMVSEGVPFLGAGSSSSVQVYPNPVRDVIYINGIEKQTTYRLLSIVGAVMQQGTLKEGNNSIPVELLPAGMYMVEVSSAGLTMTGGHGERVVRKIIKQ